MRIYSNNQIGDTLMQTPALRSWKISHSHERLTYLCGPKANSALLLQGNPYIDELVCVSDGAAADHDVKAEDAYVRAFKTGKTLAWGFGNIVGVEIDSVRYDYQVTPEEDDWARNKLAEYGDRAVLIARHSTSCNSNDPAIAVANKCLPNAIWLEVAAWLAAQGCIPVAIGSEGESADQRYANWPGPRLYGENIRNVAALCRRAYAVLTLDNGIRHLAAAVGADFLCISGTIPQWMIHCAPVREGQIIEEHYRAIGFVSEQFMMRHAKRILRRKAGAAVMN
jgi:ADP-heptose:LPS heptosyltransferase